MWPEPMNLARYIHRLTNEYTWWYICRLTDECIEGLDEHSNFIPVALFSPPTRPRHCSKLESRTHHALNPPCRHRSPTGHRSPAGPVEPPVAKLSAACHAGSAPPEPSGHQHEHRPEPAATRSRAPGHRHRPPSHCHQPPIHHHQSPATGQRRFFFKFSLNLF
jgi:hypothetical protein